MKNRSEGSCYLGWCYNIFLQSKIDSKDGKFVELHRDKEDKTLDARMTREIIDGELLVVRLLGPGSI